MKYPVEEVFKTEGVPEFTFVKPPNFNEILIDIRSPGKPVIIEGQSGTGKTTTVRKIMEESLQATGITYLSARKTRDAQAIRDLASGKLIGKYVIDDFHRLDDETQGELANLIKLAAEEYDETTYPKVVIIGINKVGSELIHLVHDIAKRCAIHRIQAASADTTSELLAKGEERLNIKFLDHSSIYRESSGDYWLTQLIAQQICLMNNVTETADEDAQLSFATQVLRAKVTERLEHSYQEAVKEFCRGKRFRATNDPYLKLLRCVSEQASSIVDLTDLANANEDVRGSINNVKEKRLSILIDSKPICDRYFYYNPETKLFAIEDPALFYYLKHLDWDDLRKACGFRNEGRSFDFDFALSFAGENRELASTIRDQLIVMDCSVFYDAQFEVNFLGHTWHNQFEEIFGRRARFVVCLLDKYHREKIWPTFERECFAPRVKEHAVIPIFLDDTPFVAIASDIVGIPFRDGLGVGAEIADRVTDEIVFKLVGRLEGE